MANNENGTRRRFVYGLILGLFLLSLEQGVFTFTPDPAFGQVLAKVLAIIFLGASVVITGGTYLTRWPLPFSDSAIGLVLGLLAPSDLYFLIVSVAGLFFH